MALSADTTPDSSPELDWRRPHPITILVEVGKAARSIVFAFVIVQGGFLGAGTALEFAVVAVPLLGALARWYTTRYALDDESVFHQYGLIRRHKQVLPRANVQNVSTKAGIVARLGSVVELQISDASATGDININLVSQAEADRLTALLRRPTPGPSQTEPTTEQVAGHRPADDDTITDPPADGNTTAEQAFDGQAMTGPGVPPPPDEAPTTDRGAAGGEGGQEALPPVGQPVERRPLVSPTLGQLARVEATTLPTATLLALTPLLALGAILVGFFTPLLSRLDEAFSDIPGKPTIPMLVAVSVGVPLLMVGVGLAQSLAALGEYRLHADPDRLRIEAGLITEARVAARRERIQQIRVLRDLPHQWLGIERVQFETADVDLQATMATRFLNPAGVTDGWRALAIEALSEVQIEEAALHPVSPLTKRRMLIRFAVFVPVLAVPTALIHPGLSAVVTLAWAWLGWWYSNRRLAVFGWACSEDQYLVRTGVFQQQLTLIRADKIQSLGTSATIFQRRLSLATVHVSTAGQSFAGRVSLPDLDQATANELHDNLSARAALTPITETL